MTVAGAVLVGGLSRRMGTDKALLDLGEGPLAGVLARRLGEAGAEPVVLVGGDDRVAGTTHVADLHPGRGPVGGVLSALRSLPDAVATVVVACDLPDLDAATLATLVNHPEWDRIVVARSSRGREPMLARWPRAVIEPLHTVLGARPGGRDPSVYEALGLAPVIEVRVDDGVVRNVNRPEEL